jgi:hypothetical protein
MGSRILRAGVLLGVACGIGCSSSTPPAPVDLTGTFNATSAGSIQSIAFTDSSRYMLQRSDPCADTGPGECFETGKYVVSAANDSISLTSDDTAQTIVLALHVLDSADETTASFHPLGLTGDSDAGLTTGSDAGLVACGTTSLVSSTPHATARSFTAGTQSFKSDPLSMPPDVVKFENAGQWGNHHLEWHTERQWNLLAASDLAWAQKQGWKMAAIQEGVAGNGFEFLMMHHAMLTILRAKFPCDTSLFAGWSTPPTNPTDPNNPLPNHGMDAFDPQMIKAIQALTNPTSLATDDDFGLYVETKLRPTPSNPQASSSDPTTGLHNYVHNRFSDSKSLIDMGDPSKNLANQVFWRLHGWIDATWMQFRQSKNLSNSDPAFVAALQNAENFFGMTMKTGGGDSSEAPPPEHLVKFFESNFGQ